MSLLFGLVFLILCYNIKQSSNEEISNKNDR